MMENRAYEDESNKSAHHHHNHLQHPHQQYNHNYNNNHTQQHYPHPQEDDFASDPSQISDNCQHHHHHHHIHQHQLAPQDRFNAYRGMEMTQHASDCHVYEDIVAPYGLALEPGGGGGFHRNLTLPLRRTSQSCESIEGNPTSSSVRVTNRERTRGSVIDRLTRDDRNRDSSREESLGSSASGSADRPTRRRRKKDCKHCKIKASTTGEENKQQQQQQRNELAVYEDRGGAELRAIFGLPDVGVCRLAPGCIGPGVVYAIGCNGTDCNGSLVSSGETTSTSATTTTTTSTTVPRFGHTQDALLDDKALIAPPSAKGGGGGGGARAGMKVNSIYAQDHWHAKDSRIFLNDPKDQSCNSPFQRAYSAVSANSPTSDNRANLRRSVRDEPAPHPARLRKHRHGWTLHFGRPLSGATCTKSLVLLLIVVLALLGIGGIALYIVFEPEKLHVIQQYLRSNARNSTSGRNGSTIIQDLEDPNFPTSLPTSTFLDALLVNATSISSINSNNVPGIDDSEDPDDEPILVTTWTTPSSTTKHSIMESTRRSAASSAITSTTTTMSAILESHSRRHRPCTECYGDEVCVARNADETPYCRAPIDLTDPSGCAGLCDSETQKCHKIDGRSFRCMESESHCLEDEWTCLNIFCIPLVKRCDGQMNCYDHSDEYNCECNLETHFHCGNQTSCLPLSKKCNGQVDCFDATDEENCTTSHDLVCPSPDEFTCRSKQQCIRRSRFCDGFRDCKDGSDEPQGCRGRCNKHEFSCRNDRCINKADKCNGIDDCGDGSDEQHCRERL